MFNSLNTHTHTHTHTSPVNYYVVNILLNKCTVTDQQKNDSYYIVACISTVVFLPKQKDGAVIPCDVIPFKNETPIRPFLI